MSFALIMPWLEASSRTRQFEDTRLFLAACKRWPRLPTTYSGFAKALKQHSARLLAVFQQQVRQAIPQLAPLAFRQQHDSVVLAVDGSRFECPRTGPNQQALGCAGKQRTAPQVMLTVLYHLGTALPYAWRVGPGIESERVQLRSLLEELPERTLLLADAGFPSYPLCAELLRRGHSFLIRVGGDKTLLRTLFEEPGEWQHGADQQVWFWPQAERDREPLSLRLIRLKTARTDQPDVSLLTNLEAAKLTDSQARTLYEQRWGVEVFFRSAKQTLEGRTLKSRTPEQALIEAAWLVGSVFLLGALVVAEHPSPQQASRWSAAKARDVVRDRIRQAHRRGRQWSRKLSRDLKGCLIDEYERTKPKSSGRYPKKKQERPPQPPKLQVATIQDRQQAQRLKAATITGSFTA